VNPSDKVPQGSILRTCDKVLLNRLLPLRDNVKEPWDEVCCFLVAFVERREAVDDSHACKLSRIKTCPLQASQDMRLDLLFFKGSEHLVAEDGKLVVGLRIQLLQLVAYSRFHNLVDLCH